MLPRRAYDPCRIRPVAADVDHVDGGPLQLSDKGRVVLEPGLVGGVEVLCHAVLVQALPNLGGQTRVFLCRCGGSTTKPFCDGQHSKIGFAAAEEAVSEEE